MVKSLLLQNKSEKEMSLSAVFGLETAGYFVASAFFCRVRRASG
jgi:hypothetical protein